MDVKNKSEEKKVKKGKRLFHRKKEADYVIDIHQELVKNKIYNFNDVMVVVVVVLAIGLILGGFITYNFTNSHGNQALDEFINTYEDIIDNYYSDLDNDKLLDAGINGMIEYLDDPYAAHMNKEETESFNEQVDGKYVGIGIEIIHKTDGTTCVYSIDENGPAFGSGLEIDDVIIKIDDLDVTDKTTSEIVKMVRGKVGSKVNITVMRNDEELTFSFVRQSVELSSVESKLIENNERRIGYLKVSIFASNTYDQFNKQLKKLELDKIDSLVVDLRDNSGGHLTTVTNMLSLFNQKGDVLYQLKTKDKIEKYIDETSEYRTYPIVVLINGTSASASEVFASNIREVYHGTIVGTKSYGKGKVQKSYQLANGATIKYTTQEWLTPNGDSIDGTGITPDNIIEYRYVVDGYDSQLQVAIDKLSE